MAIHAIILEYLPWTRSALVTLTARATTMAKEKYIILKSNKDIYHEIITSINSVLVTFKCHVKAAQTHVLPMIQVLLMHTFESRYEISNNVVCATIKASDQPAIRAV